MRRAAFASEHGSMAEMQQAAQHRNLLEVRDLVCEYRLRRTRLLGPAPVLRAVAGVSFDIPRRHSFAVVGESGSGKSTLGRSVLALEAPVSGSVRLDGQELFAMTAAQLRAARRQMGMVFQDPYESLDPRLTVGASIGDPLDALDRPPMRVERQERVAQMLESVGLRAADARRYPHEFSGGQRQRIAIARAVITQPALIVADEPVSALDVSVQAQVLNLLQDIRDRYGVAYLFISHNLAVVRHVADEVAVMQQGRFVERGPVARIFEQPEHPYTRALLASMLTPRSRRTRASN
jgi:peptide/nickel transport system ATP-binding protein